jgi:hypothetical protein
MAAINTVGFAWLFECDCIRYKKSNIDLEEEDRIISRAASIFYYA